MCNNSSPCHLWFSSRLLWNQLWGSCLSISTSLSISDILGTWRMNAPLIILLCLSVWVFILLLQTVTINTIIRNFAYVFKELGSSQLGRRTVVSWRTIVSWTRVRAMAAGGVRKRRAAWLISNIEVNCRENHTGKTFHLVWGRGERNRFWIASNWPKLCFTSNNKV